MKNTSNRKRKSSVDSQRPVGGILDGPELVVGTGKPGVFRITIEHCSDDGRPLPTMVVWHDPERFLIRRRKRPNRDELECLLSVANCLEQACCVLEETIDEQGDLRNRDSLYPHVAVAQKGINFSTRDRNHSPAFAAPALVGKR
jgi:hypothetical protein